MISFNGGQTGRPDGRRAAGSSSFSPDSESRRRRNHEPSKSGIPKRKKTWVHTRLSCKIDYLLGSNHRDRSIASEFFTDDYLNRRKLAQRGLISSWRARHPSKNAPLAFETAASEPEAAGKLHTPRTKYRLRWPMPPR